MGGVLEGWSALGPIAATSVGALVVLLLDLLLRRPGGRGASEQRISILLAIVGSLALLVAIGQGYGFFFESDGPARSIPGGTLRLDGIAAVSIVIVALAALLTLWLSTTYLVALDINQGEWYALILLSVTGMGVAIFAQHLMMLFVGLELMSLPVQTLAAFDRRRLRSNEAGLKLALLGGFASAFMLFGMALVYGDTGHLDYSGVRATLTPYHDFGTAGLALICGGLAFKLAIVPFHQWMPDVYEGAPTPAAAFMAVCVNVTAAVVLLRVAVQILPDSGELVPRLFWLAALLSMGVGHLMAMIQRNVKRMLAWSAVAHAGCLMIGFATDTPWGHGALLFYLLVYSFAMLGAFGVISVLAVAGREYERIEDFAGLSQTRPVLAAAMTIFMLALAGVPGTAVFWAKFQLFNAALGAGEITLVLFALLGSLVSVYYYLRVPVAMYMTDAPKLEHTRASTSEMAVLLVCLAVVLYLGLFPNVPIPGTRVPLLDVLTGVAVML